MPLAGACTLSEPLACSNASGTKCWFSLNACVTADNAIRDTDAILAASGVATANEFPYWIIDGAEEIAGRTPLNK